MQTLRLDVGPRKRFLSPGARITAKHCEASRRNCNLTRALPPAQAAPARATVPRDATAMWLSRPSTLHFDGAMPDAAWRTEGRGGGEKPRGSGEQWGAASASHAHGTLRGAVGRGVTMSIGGLRLVSPGSEADPGGRATHCHR